MAERLPDVGPAGDTTAQLYESLQALKRATARRRMVPPRSAAYAAAIEAEGDAIERVQRCLTELR